MNAMVRESVAQRGGGGREGEGGGVGGFGVRTGAEEKDEGNQVVRGASSAAAASTVPLGQEFELARESAVERFLEITSSGCKTTAREHLKGTDGNLNAAVNHYLGTLAAQAEPPSSRVAYEEAWNMREDERQHYQTLFDIADVKRAGAIPAQDAPEFLYRSLLPRLILREVSLSFRKMSGGWVVA